MKVRGLGTLLIERQQPIIWVVNGGSFIGSFLVEELLKKNTKVLVIDNWKTGIEQNLSHLTANKNLDVIEHDITLTLSSKLPHPNYIFYLERVNFETPDISLSVLREATHGIEQLLEKARIEKAKFLMAVFDVPQIGGVVENSNKFAKTMVKEFVKLHHVDARVVELGNIYGPRMSLIPEDPIGNIFRNLFYNLPLEKRDIKISPLYVQDAVSGLLLAMFGGETKDRVFKFSIEEIPLSIFIDTAVRIFAEKNSFSSSPNPMIDLTEHNEKFISLPASTPLSLGIAQTIEYFKMNTSRVKLTAVVKKKQPNIKLKNFNLYPKAKLLILLGILTLFLTIFILPFISLFGGVLALKFSKEALAKSSFEQAKTFSSTARTLLTFSQNRFSSLQEWPFFNNVFINLLGETNNGILLAKAASRVSAIGMVGKNLFGGMIKPNQPIQEATFYQLALDLEIFANELGLLKTELSSQLKGDLDINSNKLISTAKVLKQGGELFGFQGKKKYLVLLQNNMELRPTGGFIGSFGLLTFERGKLIDIEIQDVYTADGQLSGHVEPPEKLKEHLGEANWYLRDSNWDPDFPTSARRTEWFLEKELGIKVDGVLAMDLEVVKKLIGLAGPLLITDFSTTVSEDNFYEKTQRFAQDGFFPGSTQKKDFLTAISRVLVDTLKQKEHELISLGQVINWALDNRHMLIYLHNAESQTAIKDLGWEGGVKTVNCLPAVATQQALQAGQLPTANCVRDYLMVVDSNVGVNKANYQLDRSFLLDVSLGQDSIFHDLTISYSNKAASSDNNLRYKNYLRIYTSSGAELISASIINPVTGDKFQITQPDKTKEYDKEVFGLLVEIPASESRQVLLSWHQKIQEENTLMFFWQKQPGTLSDPLTLKFRYPIDKKLELVPFPNLTQDNILGYNTLLSGDLEVSALWKK